MTAVKANKQLRLTLTPLSMNLEKIYDSWKSFCLICELHSFPPLGYSGLDNLTDLKT